MPTPADPPSQALVAVAIAGVLLVPGAVLAFAVSRVTAWYARRWRGAGDEEGR